MKIKLMSFDNTHYASNIVQSDSILRWDVQGHTHSLIVRTKFGESINITEIDTSLIEAIPNEQILSGDEITIDDKIAVVFNPKGYINNLPVSTCPATYSVFCCNYNSSSDICTLYIPNSACQYSCNVVSQIEVKITNISMKKRLFSKSPTMCCSVFIPKIQGYIDGSLYYSFGQPVVKYPITKSMLGKPFYILPFNEKRPEIYSTSGNGFKIVIINS